MEIEVRHDRLRFGDEDVAELQWLASCPPSRRADVEAATNPETYINARLDTEFEVRAEVRSMLLDTVATTDDLSDDERRRFSGLILSVL